VIIGKENDYIEIKEFILNSFRNKRIPVKD